MYIDRQKAYWTNSSADDLDTTEILLKNNKILHGLFFCHLCIEKSLKAHVVRCIKEVPPKVHNLSYLLRLTDLELSEDNRDFLAILMIYL